MGRRSRRRTTRATRPFDEPKVRSQIARVRVSDELWAEFKTAIGKTPVSEALARHVEREVASFHKRRVAEGQVTDRELLDALETVAELQAGLDKIAWRLRFRLGDQPTSRPS